MRSSLPLVHLSVLRPITRKLDQSGFDTEAILNLAGMTRAAIENDSEQVHVMVIHQFLEIAAQEVDDPTFITSIGLQLDMSGWDFMKQAIEHAKTLGDFLTGYIVGANAVSSSVETFLEIRGHRSVFGERRLFKPTILPAQNDGYMIAMTVSMLKQALGPKMDPDRVMLIICNLAVLPQELAAFQTLQGDDLGFRIQFPSEWLSYEFGDESRESDGRAKVAAIMRDNSFLDDFRRLINQNIGKTVLNAESLASMTAMSKSKLMRLLASHDTNISREIKHGKIRYSADQLRATKRSIADISQSIGYTDPANFARAFKKETGISPTRFRKNPGLDKS